MYCTCACSENCFNPFKRKEEDDDEVQDERAKAYVEEEMRKLVEHCALGSDEEWE